MPVRADLLTHLNSTLVVTDATHFLMHITLLRIIICPVSSYDLHDLPL